MFQPQFPQVPGQFPPNMQYPQMQIPPQYPQQPQPQPQFQPQQLPPQFAPPPQQQQQQPPPAFPPAPMDPRTEFALHRLANEIEKMRQDNAKHNAKSVTSKSSRHDRERWRCEQALQADRERSLKDKFRLDELDRERDAKEIVERIKRDRELLVEDIRLEEAKQKKHEEFLVAEAKRREAEKAADDRKKAADAVKKFQDAEAERQKNEKKQEDEIADRLKKRAEKDRADEAARVKEYADRAELKAIAQEKGKEAERAKLEDTMRATLARNGVPERIIARIIKQSTVTVTETSPAAGASPAGIMCNGQIQPLVQKAFLAASTLRAFNMPVEPGRKTDPCWILPVGTSQEQVEQMFVYQKEMDAYNAAQAKLKKKCTWGLFR